MLLVIFALRFGYKRQWRASIALTVVAFGLQVLRKLWIDRWRAEAGLQFADWPTFLVVDFAEVAELVAILHCIGLALAAFFRRKVRD